MNWQQKVTAILLKSGTQGVQRNAIAKQTQTLRNKVKAGLKDLDEYLISLAKERKAQRFSIKYKGKQVQVWRATVELEKE